MTIGLHRLGLVQRSVPQPMLSHAVGGVAGLMDVPQYLPANQRLPASSRGGYSEPIVIIKAVPMR